MNYQRVLSVASGYFLLTGYQIRTLDGKSRHYRLTPWGVLHFLILLVIYLICFEYHFEKSSIMKILLDLSPFLKNLVIVQIWLGLKAFVFCIIEWRSVLKVLNGLVEILGVQGGPSSRRDEILAYIMFFSTFVVALCVGLYIAIEMKFELPPVDQIMIATALFIPHFALAGSLRLYTLYLWLLRHKLGNLKENLLNPVTEPSEQIVIEIINPAIQFDSLTPNRDRNTISTQVYRETLKSLEDISSYLKIFNTTVQRQLCVLNGLISNCLLYAIYTRLYFNKTWYVVFTDSKRRIFYAFNTSIFVCIYLDYMLLLVTLCSFNKMKHTFSEEVLRKTKDVKDCDNEKYSILKNIRRVLKEELNLQLYGLMDFNVWNFLIVQYLMLLVIALVVLYQYFNDEIVALTQLVESGDE